MANDMDKNGSKRDETRRFFSEGHERKLRKIILFLYVAWQQQTLSLNLIACTHFT
jgi:hypothetical protein